MKSFYLLTCMALAASAAPLNPATSQADGLDINAGGGGVGVEAKREVANSAAEDLDILGILNLRKRENQDLVDELAALLRELDVRKAKRSPEEDLGIDLGGIGLNLAKRASPDTVEDVAATLQDFAVKKAERSDDIDIDLLGNSSIGVKRDSNDSIGDIVKELEDIVKSLE
ncbi:hypothetical protein N7468_003904 [Penicillium chermesinum]|uniref:Uncharacterized protein n=1 Tax=Penicillium chermesinum TaxID=63820 RepID=A0A9W9P7I1_9EURO|nr:uncharacterized protein N7468_003904 [Penicillium chermesinum]KAJ5239285.1 hypothetical protein N7468_003904 [Penicillium chermesinum]